MNMRGKKRLLVKGSDRKDKLAITPLKSATVITREERESGH